MWNRAYSSKAVDQTTWDQAAGMNTDGSHGSLKCGACHEVNTADIPTWVDNLRYNGSQVSGNFDRAVSWMHTYTDEATQSDGVCLNCHGDPAFEDPRNTACRGRHDDEWSAVSCTGSESSQWKRHLTEGRVAPSVWEQVSITRTGSTCGW
jgi:hypothetical protein